MGAHTDLGAADQGAKNVGDGLIGAAVSPSDKRLALRESLASSSITRLPGAINPLTAKLIAEIGFDGVYVSGGAFSAGLGLPDIGLTTLSEVTAHSAQIARSTDLPVFVDADTGFGEPMSAARTVVEFEDHGIAGLHLEDQINPKRCGHLDGKALVPTEDMVRRLGAAVAARRDPNFVICARTDAAGVDGIDAAIDRAKAYADAGADLIFTEALHTEADFEKFRQAVDTPLLANMTEFGRSSLIPARTLESIGFDAVIYPVTTLRLAMGAIEAGLRTIHETGTQESLLPVMQTRSRLYELLEYERYNEFDSGIFNFTLDERPS